MKRNALVVVDVQHDFASPEGKLYVPRGEQVVTVINTFLHRYDHLIFTQDWHPIHSHHFEKWPVHCVANTPGADFAKWLTVPGRATVVRKGLGQADDGYSAFRTSQIVGAPEDLTFLKFLQDSGIQHLDITGLATDHCVKATALDAVDFGFTVRLLMAGCRGVDPVMTDYAMEQMHCRHVEFAWRP